MSEKIKATAIEQEVRSLAEKNPDFVYNNPDPNRGCLYVYDGKPSCIVGHALANLGVEIEFLQHLDTAMDGGLGALEALQTYDDFEVDDKQAADLVSLAQNFQDSGVPWGQAVEKAEEEAERMAGRRVKA